MNEKSLVIALRHFTPDSTPYGSVTGRLTYTKLVDYIDNLSGVKIIGISLGNLDRADASFFREALIYTAKRYRKEIFLFVLDAHDEDLFANLQGAALASDIHLTCWNEGVCKFAGPALSESTKILLDAASNQRETTTTKIADALNISVQNASTRLKRLSDEGLLMRVAVDSETGGKEFIYQIIGQ
jgi:hypothetical protein